MLRLWELNFEISRASSTSLHIQIAKIISQAIELGRLTSGTALPGSRVLANRIQVNRKTVVQAYDALIEEGWLTTQQKRGTFVAPYMPTQHAKDTVNLSLDINKTRAQTRAQITVLQKASDTSAISTKHFTTPNPAVVAFQHKPVSQLLDHQLTNTSEIITLSTGSPDNRLMPFAPISRAMRHALIAYARHRNNHEQNTSGHPVLKEALASMLNIERGLQINPDHICVVPSSQAGIYVVAKQFIQAGDGVVIEQLGNPLARQAFTDCGVRIFDVTHNHEGMDLTHLALLCQQQNIRAVYLAPNHQIPTTVRLSNAKKIQLLKLAELYNFLIIEDDRDSAFYFSNGEAQIAADLYTERAPIASIEATRVILIGGLSQILGDAFSVAYIVADPQIIQSCTAALLTSGGKTDETRQLVIAELLNTGEIKKHHRRSLHAYATRRLLFASLLTEALDGYVTFEMPNLGLAFWLQLHPAIDMMQLNKDLQKENIYLQMGNGYAALRHMHVPALRIGFADLNKEEMQRVIARLKNAFYQQTLNLRRA